MNASRRTCVIKNALNGLDIITFERSLPYAVDLDDFEPRLGLDSATVVEVQCSATCCLKDFIFTPQHHVIDVVKMRPCPRDIAHGGKSWAEDAQQRRGWRRTYKEFSHFAESAYPENSVLLGDVTVQYFVRLILQAFVQDRRVEAARITKVYPDGCGGVELGEQTPWRGREWHGVYHVLCMRGQVSVPKATEMVSEWLTSEEASPILAHVERAVEYDPCGTYFA